MTTSINYDDKIPNNVDLSSNRRLQRALEGWQPKFMNWWAEMGPTLETQGVYLRTAVSVGRDGWAHFDHVHVPDYRWGIFLAERDLDRRIAFGEHMGEPAWQQVPGEYRADLQRLIVIQGDTEPVRPAEPVPGQRGGGPASVGDGVPVARLLRQGRPRRGRSPPAA